MEAAEKEKLGLREIKKRRTRATIARVAMELFDRYGYQQTTIPEIAEAADVSPRTVSTYFPLKEEIVFESWGERGATLEKALLDREEGQTTAEALRQWLLGERDLWERRKAEWKRQRRIIDSDAGLQAFEHSHLHEFELLLAESIARDMGQRASDLEPRIAASAAVAIFGLLEDEHFEAPDAGIPPLSHQLGILDKALAFISAGADAIQADN